MASKTGRGTVGKRALKQAAGTNPLLRHVARWAIDTATDYGGRVEGPMADLFYGGCEAGTVSHLVYYKDTVPFAKRFFDQITELAVEAMEGRGERGDNVLAFLSRDAGAGDIGNGDTFYNFLAWWGFIEAARRLADLTGMDTDKR